LNALLEPEINQALCLKTATAGHPADAGQEFRVNGYQGVATRLGIELELNRLGLIPELSQAMRVPELGDGL